MTSHIASAGLLFLSSVFSVGAAEAQVHYHSSGAPWNQRARNGPDAVVDGWYYNLGVTGIRVELVEDAPTHLVVRHVFEGSRAEGRVAVGDHIVAAGGVPFTTPHRNGYGEEFFGAAGPIADFAKALDEAFGSEGKGRLELTLQRDGKERSVKIGLDSKVRPYSATYPADCKETDRQLEGLLESLAEQQRDDGSWGSPPHDLFAPLALLASGDKKYRKAIFKSARFHARTTSTADDRLLVNWHYMSAGIFLAEYYLATRETWVIAELEEVRDFLMSTQYVDMSQINPEVKNSHPHAYPEGPTEKYGGWGHNPGFEGYGPIAMLTGQGALALSLMARCGVEVDEKRLEAAFNFIARGTGRNGYVWYGDEVAGHDAYADMGRTGAAGIANALSPYEDSSYKAQAVRHASIIAEHPESFPDTHGSPTMGMAFAALAAGTDSASFRALMDANRWWFTLSACADGTFYYQPNRDNAGYGGDSRLSASAVTALIFSIPKRSLHITGKPFKAR